MAMGEIKESKIRSSITTTKQLKKFLEHQAELQRRKPSQLINMILVEWAESKGYELHEDDFK